LSACYVIAFKLAVTLLNLIAESAACNIVVLFQINLGAMSVTNYASSVNASESSLETVYNFEKEIQDIHKRKNSSTTEYEVTF
jgi:hypothetical protein